jgi:PEGA domain
MQTPRRHRVSSLALIVSLVAGLAGPAQAAGGSVVVLRADGVDAPLASRVEREIQRHRTVLPVRPMPPLTQSPEELANVDRVTAISRALDRARKHEEVAGWDACAKEAGDRLGDATELLASTGELALLRDLHLQIGACLSLGDAPANAQPHFRKATLLDESAPPRGSHREEAELALAQARDEVLLRQRGPLRIDTDPPGAAVWLDGVRIEGTTPLEVPVRLGSHFITLRRFRFEPDTRQALMQPKSEVRFVLGAAQRDTLRRQLAEVATGKRKVEPGELRQARAAFSGADELVLIEPAKGPTNGTSLRVEVIEPLTGAAVRSQLLAGNANDDDLKAQICNVLAASCPQEAGGIPWYVWPIVGVAVTGGAVALGFYLDSQRATAFCPAGGC